MIKKLICWFRGHVPFDRHTEYQTYYIHIPAGRGAFCRDPERYEYAGRLYKCRRCGELVWQYGIALWEVEDLILTILENLPNMGFENAFSAQNYDFTALLFKNETPN